MSKFSPEAGLDLAELLDCYRTAERGTRERPARRRDAMIRPALRDFVRRKHGTRGGVRLVEEFAVGRGSVRIDLAVLNGRMHGYEIKSAADRLDRLGQQAEGYSAVFDTVTLVTEQRHLAQALAVIPDWWGVVLAEPAAGGFRLRSVRPGGCNPEIDPTRLAELLWKSETLALLRSAGAKNISERHGRPELWARLAQLLSLSRLRHAVLVTLRQRQGWRADPTPA